MPVTPLTSLWTSIRTGPNANFTDTFNTAAAIYAALGGAASSASAAPYKTRLCNMTSFTETLMASMGVTVSVSPIAAGACVNLLFVFNAAGTSLTITGS